MHDLFSLMLMRWCNLGCRLSQESGYSEISQLRVYSFNNIFKVLLGLEYSKCNGSRAFHSNETRYSKAIYKLLLDYDKMQGNSSNALLKCSVFTFAFLSRLSIEKASVMTSQPFIAILTPARDQNISDKNVKVADFLPSIVTVTSFVISMLES